jgi:hypothetical protein
MKDAPRAAYVQSADVYRSLPIDRIQPILARGPTTVIGAAGAALRRTLGNSTWHVSTPDRTDRRGFAQGMANVPVSDFTIMLEPDIAFETLRDPELLFLVRQRSRWGVVFPVRCTPVGVSMVWKAGMSAFETNGLEFWRWSDTPAAVIDLGIYLDPLKGRQCPVLRFSSWKPPGRERCASTLAVQEPDGETLARADIGSAVCVRLAQAQNELRIVGSVAGAPTNSDPRCLSFAIVNPVVEDRHGNSLLGVQHACAGHMDWPLELQHCLHSAGFGKVAGIVTDGFGSVVKRYPASEGNAYRGLDEDSAGRWVNEECQRRMDEVLWVAAGHWDLWHEVWFS